jgi:hypothetical protein
MGHLGRSRRIQEESMSSIKTGVLGLAVMAACAYNPPPIPVDARPSELQELAGRWTGHYHGGASGRSGSIEFILVAGEDHAHGDVVMVPRGAHRPYHSWRETSPMGELPTPEVLTIRLVAVESGEITGELDPYRDPDCDCRAVTSFRGRARGDVIEGTFVTYSAQAAGPSYGTWKVRRQRR